ncbi:winged helix-turn-helix domain-containing protein [Phenylobacterium sp.]|uniref:winged helix-turn-helix domain-containing protein n=1 Tax=Phenylobacterium sp. TaxID=1871053 RepID=UPI00286AADE3|nr:winged helix-turn-helix domain-containing protein [Phenylobacterium sp.]
MQLAHQAAFSIASLDVRPSTREVVWDGGREVLQPRVMQVLVALALTAGDVVSRDDLIVQCWDGRIVSEDAINFVIGQVRKLATLTGAFRLETISRVGYRLVALTPEGSAAPPRQVSARLERRRVLMLSTAGVIGVGLAAAGGVIGWRALRPAPPAPVTIAVMAFDDLSPGQDTRYLAQGLAREVRNSLSRVAGLSVIADASSFALSGLNLTDKVIARRLGADLLLKGSVAQSSGNVRISTELIDLASERQVWAETHESNGGDLFQLQDAVAGAVIQQLIGRIGADRIQQPPQPRRRDPEVFRVMLGANQLIEQTRALRMVNRVEAAFDAADEAQVLVSRALHIDPRDPGALVVQSVLVRNGWTRALARQPLSTAQRGAAAAELLRQALTTDPNDPGALAWLADYYRRIEWRWDDAATLYQRALAIDPNHLEAHWGYGYQLDMLGRALEALTHARALMRLDPETVWRRLALPRILRTVGASTESWRLFNAELTQNPGNVFLIREMCGNRLTQSDAPGLDHLIRRVREELWRGAPPAPVAALLARAAAGAEALRGRPAALLALVDADVATYDAGGELGGTPQGRASVDFLFIYAIEYAWAGAVTPALSLLDRALAGRSTYWPDSMPFGLAHFPATVRADPRYAALWQSDRKRQQIVASRLRSVQHGQMAGYLPDGRRVTPRLPADPMARRV